MSVRFTVKSSIWFLDTDLLKSASYLTDIDVEYNIIGCYNILLCSFLYSHGIRRHKALQYIIKEQPPEFDYLINCLTVEWPMKKKKPACKHAKNHFTKFARTSKQNYDYILEYLNICLNEYFIRYSMESKYAPMYDWFYYNKHNIPVDPNHAGIFLPPRSIERRYRRVDYIEGSRLYYKFLNMGPGATILAAYDRRSVPEWFNLDENYIP